MRKRILFSVVEVTEGDKTHHELEWHPEMYRVLDEASPNGEYTDKIIDLVEELFSTDAAASADDAD